MVRVQLFIPPTAEELPAALEALLPPALMSSASGQSVSGFFRAITSYVTAARKSPVEELARWETPNITPLQNQDWHSRIVVLKRANIAREMRLNE